MGAINGAFMMGRRKAFEKVGLFDEDFFMYGDDLDLCYRFTQAGYRVVYDGRVSITHLKGTSVAKDYDRMSQAIFDANKAFYLKHFNPRNSGLGPAEIRSGLRCLEVAPRFRARLSGYVEFGAEPLSIAVDPAQTNRPASAARSSGGSGGR